MNRKYLLVDAGNETWMLYSSKEELEANILAMANEDPDGFGDGNLPDGVEVFEIEGEVENINGRIRIETKLDITIKDKEE
jgi:hypothetical protein